MIVVLGSINLDICLSVANLPQPGETISATGRQLFAGGKGANQALAARRAGAEVAFVGAVGRDAGAEVALAHLRAAGVDLSALEEVETPTGTAMILVEASGENLIVVEGGANRALSEASVAVAVDRARGGTLVLQQEIDDALTELALQTARAQGVRSVLNLSPFGARSGPLSQLADVLITNEGEWEALQAWASAKGLAANWWRSKVVLVTRGSAGVYVFSPEGDLSLPAPVIQPVDTVGAGDTFCGYLVAALTEMELPEAVALAIRAASLACLRPGAQPAIPTRQEVARHGA
ncbi:ribokinase [Arenibacterium sp. LLYu02]|uniref:ribokinase n=1 Tax=Arenibacterium sp. LLYu02 TaxID=3404132 RepID=UPI003B2171D0